ncbi:MAG: hypothetical protein HFJ06_16475, partial [Lachnospiraceae bacterium]|nr:hypothetical protein [Lachnospiraceae bacterium]
MKIRKIYKMVSFALLFLGFLLIWDVNAEAKVKKHEKDVVSLEHLLAKLNSENVWVDHDINSYHYKWSDKTGSLIKIDLSGYGIKGELDLNNFTELREIDCSANKISCLKINKLNKLKSLNCRKNNLSD